ncbi:acetyl-CoA C-acyltransferase, partial [Pseudomonadales bacterium]|nr:acetyl-CoA C-acyltransferase [Pseudomonadales bacterium]
MTQEIYVAAGVRSALGNFGGTLKDKPMTELASEIVQSCVKRSGAAASDFDHLVFTTTCPTDKDSLFAARVVG